MNYVLNRTIESLKHPPVGVVLAFAVVFGLAFFLGKKSSTADYEKLVELSRENAEVVRLRAEAEAARKTANDAIAVAREKDAELALLSNRLAELDKSVALARAATQSQRKRYEDSKLSSDSTDNRPLPERVADLCTKLAEIGRPCTASTANRP